MRECCLLSAMRSVRIVLCSRTKEICVHACAFNSCHRPIVPNCSYLLVSSVGIRRAVVPPNKVAENKKSHVPWRHVRQQRLHRGSATLLTARRIGRLLVLITYSTQEEIHKIQRFCGVRTRKTSTLLPWSIVCRLNFRHERPRKPFGFGMCWQNYPFYFPLFFPSTFLMPPLA